jgi:hypothetical protein
MGITGDMDMVPVMMTSLRREIPWVRVMPTSRNERMGSRLNSERLDSIASRALTHSLGFCDLCRGFPARSIREQAI